MLLSNVITTRIYSIAIVIQKRATAPIAPTQSKNTSLRNVLLTTSLNPLIALAIAFSLSTSLANAAPQATTPWGVDLRKDYGALSSIGEGLNTNRRALLSVTCHDKSSVKNGRAVELTGVMVRLMIEGYWSSGLHHGIDIRVDNYASRKLANDRGLNAAGYTEIQRPSEYPVLHELTVGKSVAVRVNQSGGPELYFKFDLTGSAKAIGDVLTKCFQYDADKQTKPTAEQLSTSLFDDM